MSNNVYKNGELSKFIKRFSGPFDVKSESFIGVEFKFRANFYRITRVPTLDDEGTLSLRKKFNKKVGKYEVMKLPIKKYPDHYEETLDIFIGIYDTIDDLLENFLIEGVVFKEVVTSSETVFLGFD